METIRKILVRSPNWIGDQVLAYPFFHYLRELYPDAHIAVVCVPWVQAVQFRNLVNEVFILPKPLSPGLLAKWDVLEATARNLKRKGPWDLSICLPNSFSSAWLLYRAGSKWRRGYRSDGRGLLLNQPVRWTSGRGVRSFAGSVTGSVSSAAEKVERQRIHSPIRHRSEDYVRLLPETGLTKGLGSKFSGKLCKEFWGVPPVNELDDGIPGVLPSFDAEKAWPDAEAIEPPLENFWILAPGSTAESRRWSGERFAALAGLIAKETGWKGILVGGAAEKAFAARLADDPTLNLVDWTGRGTVASYWKVFRQAKFSVCNDSGLAHVASLCSLSGLRTGLLSEGRSTIQVIWGAGDPKRTEPMGPGKVKIFFNPVDCWPCESNICLQPSGQKLECLGGIHPDAVWKEIKTGIRI